MEKYKYTNFTILLSRFLTMNRKTPFRLLQKRTVLFLCILLQFLYSILSQYPVLQSWTFLYYALCLWNLHFPHSLWHNWWFFWVCQSLKQLLLFTLSYPNSELGLTKLISLLLLFFHMHIEFELHHLLSIQGNVPELFHTHRLLLRLNIM